MYVSFDLYIIGVYNRLSLITVCLFVCFVIVYVVPKADSARTTKAIISKPQSNYLCQDILLHLINYLLFINLIIFLVPQFVVKVPHWGTIFESVKSTTLLW